MKSDTIKSHFGGKVRNRACALVIKEEKILLVAHDGLADKPFLAPPGGASSYGETLSEAVIRELREETGLTGQVASLLFIHEYVSNPYHAIEYFFLVKDISGKLTLGHDPELPSSQQIVKKVGYYDIADLKSDISVELHQMLIDCQSVGDLIKKTGYFCTKISQ